MVVRRSDTRYKEQIAQDQAKWRGLIRRGSGENETKRTIEAEQKRAQQKARAKALPTELSSSDLSCSICNRQFRAKTGLISHLGTQNSHTSRIWLGLAIVSIDRGTIFTSLHISIRRYLVPYSFPFPRYLLPCSFSFPRYLLPYTFPFLDIYFPAHFHS